MNRHENRIIYLDLLRIFSIFCMMFLHVSAYYWSSTSVFTLNWQIYNIYDSLVRFCVPIFVMISGVFFLDPKKRYTIPKLFKQNISRIVTAFIFWSLAYALVTNYSGSVGADYLKSVWYSFIFGQQHLWFLYALCGLYLIVPFLRKICENQLLMEYFLVLTFVFTIGLTLFKSLPQTMNIVSVIESKSKFYFAFGYTGYFVLGYYLNRINVSAKIRKISYILGIISLVLTIGVTIYLSLKERVGVETMYSYFMPNVYFVAVAVFLFFKKRFLNREFKTNQVQMIIMLSKLSFGAYLVHDFVNIFLRSIGLTVVLFTPVLSIPIISIIVFILSYLIAYLISKIPVLNKYIM